MKVLGLILLLLGTLGVAFGGFPFWAGIAAGAAGLFLGGRKP